MSNQAIADCEQHVIVGGSRQRQVVLRGHQHVQQRHHVQHLAAVDQVGFFANLRRNVQGAQLLLQGQQTGPFARQHHHVRGLEAGVGIALVFGYFVRPVAIAAAVLLSVFTIAMVSAIVRGLDIACGCGLGDTQVGWLDVARDVLLIAVALLIAWRTGKERVPQVQTA